MKEIVREIEGKTTDRHTEKRVKEEGYTLIETEEEREREWKKVRGRDREKERQIGNLKKESEWEREREREREGKKERKIEREKVSYEKLKFYMSWTQDDQGLTIKEWLRSKNGTPHIVNSIVS